MQIREYREYTGSLPLTEDQINRLHQLLEAANRIVILPHTAPDGDALGSTMGLKRVLANVYPHKAIYIISPDNIESYLQWMQGLEEVVLFPDNEEVAIDLIQEAHLVLHLDHNTASRLKHPRLVNASQNTRAQRILIDHHLDPDNSFDLSFSYTEMSSTCQLVYHLVQALGWTKHIDAIAATNLLTGIITDTGRFMYNCYDPSLFACVSDLLSLGAAYSDIINALSYEGRLQQITLMGYALHKKMELYPHLGTAILTLTQDELQMLGANKGDTEGLVNIPLSVAGITSSCLIREDKSQVKLSLRSIGSIPINLVASRGFSGGGHLNAAGAEYLGSLEEAKNIYLYELERVLQEVKA